MFKQYLSLLLVFISIIFTHSRAITTKEDLALDTLDVNYVEQVFDCLLESEKFLERYVMTLEPQRMIDLFIELVIEGDKVATQCFLEYPPPSNYHFNE